MDASSAARPTLPDPGPGSALGPGREPDPAPEAGPTRLPWPPLLYFSAIALTAGLQVVLPLGWLSEPWRALVAVPGAALAIAGFGLDIAALRALARGRTTVLPHRPAAHLVTEGPFAWSRNPIYLGNALALIGLALVFGVAWGLVIVPAVSLIVERIAIRAEERHLAARFGSAWTDYAARVPRWFAWRRLTIPRVRPRRT